MRLAERFSPAIEGFRVRIWPLPLLTIVVAVVVGVTLPIFDDFVDPRLPQWLRGLVFDGGPSTARSVLSSVGGALITATSLTFSLTIVTLQLASSQASPRLLRTFSRDPQVHRTLAVFLGTFAYSLAVLRAVRDSTESRPAAVPQIAVTLAFVLALVSVATLVLFISHLSAQLRIESMLRSVHEDTNGVIETAVRRRPQLRAGAPVPVPSAAAAVGAPRSGFLTGIDRPAVVAAAARHGVVVHEEHVLGDDVLQGAPLFRWWADPASAQVDGSAVEKALLRAVELGYERTAAQDIEFGLRQMVEIGVKALSPGINDPTTAVHALGHIGDLLVRIECMPQVPDAVADEDGRTRLLTAALPFPEVLNRAVTQIRRYGASDVDVVNRLFRLYGDLAQVLVSSDAREAVRKQSARLVPVISGGDFDETEREHLRAMAAEVDRRLAAR